MRNKVKIEKNFASVYYRERSFSVLKLLTSDWLQMARMEVDYSLKY